VATDRVSTLRMPSRLGLAFFLAVIAFMAQGAWASDVSLDREDIESDHIYNNKPATEEIILTNNGVSSIAVTYDVTGNINVSLSEDEVGSGESVTFEISTKGVDVNTYEGELVIKVEYEEDDETVSFTKTVPISIEIKQQPISINTVLKQRSIYGSKLSDIDIVTQGAMGWPPFLKGSDDGRDVYGYWEWKFDDDVGHASQITSPNYKCPAPSGTTTETSYPRLKQKAAVFIPYNSNYEELLVDVHLCVEPFQLKIRPPTIEGNGIKIYDGTESYPSNMVTIGTLESPHPSFGGEVTVATAKYSSKNAGNHQITISYKLEGSGAQDFLPPEPHYNSGRIVPRPVTISGFAPKDKFYDGNKKAEVGYNNIQLSGIIGDEASINSALDSAFELFEFETSQASEFALGSTTEYIPRKLIPLPAAKAIELIPKLGDYPVTNYDLQLPELIAVIKRASFIDFACKELQIPNEDCNRGNLENIVAGFIEKIEAKHVEASYGDYFWEFSDNIKKALPTKMGDLFGDIPDKEDEISWNWMACRPGLQNGCYNDQILKIADHTGYVAFSHGSGNYEMFDTGIPVPIKVHKKKLIAQVHAIDREYDINSASVATVLTINNALNQEGYFHKAALEGGEVVVLASVTNRDASKESKEVNISYNWKSTSSPLKELYELPALPEPKPRVTIRPALCKAGSEPMLNKNIVYDTLNLAELVKFTNNGNVWSWDAPIVRLPNPADSAKDYIEKVYVANYRAERCLGDNYDNYYPDQRQITLAINKRSTDDGVISADAKANGTCGTSTASLHIEPSSVAATIWFNGEARAKTFTVPDRPYGYHNIDYQIKAQDYDKAKTPAEYKVPYNRLLPFDKVVYTIRGGAMTIRLDSSQYAEQHFFRQYNIDPHKTQWLKDKTIVATGRSLGTIQNITDDYWVKLYSTSGDYVISSCYLNGETPITVPIMPNTNFIASSFSSKVVAGGTTLTLNTPHGGTISIYTIKGERVSRMQAIDNRTIIKMPTTQGMYIVKLEAK